MSDDGLTPGFYQARLRGNKSGRVSPRDAIRGSRRSEVFAQHGLIPQGAANPRQGQLFDIDKVAPATSPEDMARSRGVAPPLASSRPGFMPGLERKTDRGSRSAIVTGLNRLAEARTRTGADRGTGAPVAEAMKDRQELYESGKPANWYTGVGADGTHRSMQPGMARQAIDSAAIRTGVSNTEMTRAVALTSPRTTWDKGGAPGTTDHRMPNMESAENVINAVKSLPPGSSREEVREAGRGAPGRALDTMKAKAADYHANVPTTSPISVSDPSSQKVPNFEQSLHLSHVDPAIQKQAAGSYTVDAWDTKSLGGDEKLLDTDTGYAVAHMTGVRAALKAGELPPNFQARTWSAIRSQPGRYGESPETLGENRLLMSDTRGKLKVNPNAMPDDRAQAIQKATPSRNLQRGKRDIAADLDLPF